MLDTTSNALIACHPTWLRPSTPIHFARTSASEPARRLVGGFEGGTPATTGRPTLCRTRGTARRAARAIASFKRVGKWKRPVWSASFPVGSRKAVWCFASQHQPVVLHSFVRSSLNSLVPPLSPIPSMGHWPSSATLSLAVKFQMRSLRTGLRPPHHRCYPERLL
jgi:hypothetical protein